jgi:GNAT superfamily N-acetyltransferase
VTHYSRLVADVSVRAALPADTSDIGRIQIETWRTAYAPILPAESLAGMDTDTAGRTWLAALTDPPSPRHRVLVAREQSWTVGFIAFGPADDLQPNDPTPERTAAVSALIVEPRWGRRGHGSRLLAAAVDHCRDDGLIRAITWVPDSDVASTSFYTSAGWARDGYVRLLDTGAGTVREVRLHVSLAEDETP